MWSLLWLPIKLHIQKYCLEHKPHIFTLCFKRVFLVLPHPFICPLVAFCQRDDHDFKSTDGWIPKVFKLAKHWCLIISSWGFTKLVATDRRTFQCYWLLPQISSVTSKQPYKSHRTDGAFMWNSDFGSFCDGGCDLTPVTVSVKPSASWLVFTSHVNVNCF